MKQFLGVLLLALLFSLTQAQTLSVWVWDINKPAMESTIASFQEMHPGVEVIVEDLGNQNVFDRGLAGCAAGGLDLPDVYLIENNEAPIFWAQFPDCFADLREFGAADIVDDFAAFKWTELSANGAIYAIPYDSGPTAMFYRRDLYEQAGINPDDIATWADFMAAGEQLLAATDGQVRMGTVAKGADDEWFRMLANQADCFYFSDEGDAVTVNQAGCVQGLETLKMLVDADVLAIGGWTEQLQLIQNNATASAFFGSWYGGVLQGEVPEQTGLWGAYLTPAFEAGGIRASNIGGSALAVPASSRNPQLAYDFIMNAIGSADGQIAILRDYGLTPTHLGALEHPYLLEGVPFFADQPVWGLILSTLGDVPPANGTQFFDEARSVMTSIVNDYLDGRFATAQEALNDAARRISQATGLPIAQ